jgi:hypothetical protein
LVLNAERTIAQGSGLTNGIEAKRDARRRGERNDDLRRHGDYLQLHVQELLRGLVRTVEDARQRQQVDDSRHLLEGTLGIAGLESIVLRDAVALARVVPPLPVQVDSRERPRPDTQGQRRYSHDHGDWHPGEQGSITPEAIGLEATRAHVPMTW